MWHPILLVFNNEERSFIYTASSDGDNIPSLYADDICLISLSSTGIQQVLNMCQSYATGRLLLYNGSKSYYLCFKSKLIKISQPSFFKTL